MVDSSITQLVERAVEQSAQVEQEDRMSYWDMDDRINRSHVLPTLDTVSREHYLYDVGLHSHNGLWQGAVSGITKVVATTPYEITGDSETMVPYYQKIFLYADFGEGMEVMMGKLLWDLFNSDYGAVMEIIGGGPLDGPIVGPVTGIAHLDVSRCYFTNDHLYPVVYWDTKGKFHKMHWTRVHRFRDQPLPRHKHKHMQLSALSRAISFVNQAILQSQYVQEGMENEPPPGLLNVGKLSNLQEWEAKWKQYRAARRNMESSNYAPMMHWWTTGEKPDIEFIPFAKVPQGFDPDKYNGIVAKGIAHSLNIDPQDIWPLDGGPFGRDGQSKTLDKKSQNKGLGFLFGILGRGYNLKVLPRSLQMRYKYKDNEQSIEQANIATAHGNVANILINLFDKTTAQLYMARTVSAVGDVVLDRDGKLIVGESEDVSEENDEGTIETGDLETADGEDNTTPPSGGPPARSNPKADEVTATDSTTLGQKDYSEVEDEFMQRIEGALTARNDGDVDSRRFGIIFRGHLNRGGQKALLEGLNKGGIKTTVIEGDDRKILDAWFKRQSAFVSALVKETKDTTLSEDQIKQRARLWASISLKEIYMEGLVSADRNGMYKWKLDPAKENCKDCLRLDGQVHRIKDFHSRGWMPGSQKLACAKGECGCDLEKTTEPAKGRY